MVGQAHVEVFRGDNGRWWWHLRAANGHIVSGSAQGCRSRWYCKRMARKLVPGYTVEVIG